MGMRETSFKLDDLVSIKDDGGRYVTVLVRTVEPGSGETYSVTFQNMQTGDMFKREYLYQGD
jgi:hypothetical protein